LNYINIYEMIFMLFNKFTFQATVITDAVLSTCEQKAVYTQTPTKKKKNNNKSEVLFLACFGSLAKVKLYKRCPESVTCFCCPSRLAFDYVTLDF